MDTITVRAATGDDVPWAARLMSSSDPWITLRRDYDTCLRACSSPLDVLDIADAGGERSGFVLVRPAGVAGAPYVVSIGVSPAQRGRGVGGALLNHVEQIYRARARHLFLCVSSFNPRARHFYERHGFETVGVLREFIIEGADEILMQKRLTRADPSAPID